jgi:hypothetical protein
METNTESKSETNTEGVYRVPSLRPGPYKVSVTATGFKMNVRAGLTLRIGENLGVDVKLELGAVTESIQVTNSLPLLETQSSSTGQVMDGQYFYSLPNYQHWEKGVLFYLECTFLNGNSSFCWPARAPPPWWKSRASDTTSSMRMRTSAWWTRSPRDRCRSAPRPSPRPRPRPKASPASIARSCSRPDPRTMQTYRPES